MTKRVRVIVLASGTGSTLAHLMTKHRELNIEIVAVISNNKNALALQNADNASIPTHHTPSKSAHYTEKLVQIMQQYQPELVVLAGYMCYVPQQCIEAVSGMMINTHPALLPKFGGQGMYGDHVHAAVLAANENESGATVHWVNNAYDRGQIIDQTTVTIAPHETVESLRVKVQKAEKSLLCRVIQEQAAHISAQTTGTSKIKENMLTDNQNYQHTETIPSGIKAVNLIVS